MNIIINERVLQFSLAISDASIASTGFLELDKYLLCPSVHLLLLLFYAFCACVSFSVASDLTADIALVAEIGKHNLQLSSLANNNCAMYYMHLN